MPVATTRRKGKAKPSLPASQHRFEKIIETLHEHYRIGQEAEKHGSTVAYALENGMSEHTVRKFRAFANGYSQAEFNSFCRLRRPSGLPLHSGYIKYLLAAESLAAKKKKNGKKERQRFEKLAATNNWSQSQLHAAIRAEYGVENPHGRTMVVAEDFEVAVRQAIKEGQEWFKRTKVLFERVIKSDPRSKILLTDTSNLLRAGALWCHELDELLLRLNDDRKTGKEAIECDLTKLFQQVIRVSDSKKLVPQFVKLAKRSLNPDK